MFSKAQTDSLTSATLLVHRLQDNNHMIHAKVDHDPRMQHLQVKDPPSVRTSSEKDRNIREKIDAPETYAHTFILQEDVHASTHIFTK